MISVIVPAYNLKDYISRTLDSILAQTYKQLEVIVVDDGSTDGTAAVLDEYVAVHPQLRVIHQSNSGVTSARLHGVSVASGEWIGFVDGDDEIEPDMYERLMENALQYRADISHCGYQMVFPDGRIHYFHNSGRIMQQDNTCGMKDLLDGSVVEPGLCNKLFRRNLFDCLISSDLMEKSIKINEDLLMNFYLFKQAQHSVFEDVCPYHYVVRYSSASRQKLNQHKIFDPIRVRELILTVAPEAVKDEAQKALVNVCLDTCNSIILTGPNEYNPEFQQVCDLLSSHRDSFSLIGKKRQYMAQAVLHMPRLYGLLYRIYVCHFYKSIYE